jgi:hypothetical protein
MSATAWVSAAEPDRQHQMVSCTCVSLSVTRFAMYAPVVVLLSAARITPSLKLIAMLQIVKQCEAAVGRYAHRGTQTVQLSVT